MQKESSESKAAKSAATGQQQQAADLALLEKAQKMIQIERKLTATLEKVEPWLLLSNNNTNRNASISHHRPRVRPIPTSMDQVEAILAVARNYASKTSAPAGWNPNAPLIGFATPNPLPHQLRGGALAALQLERARAMAAKAVVEQESESNNKRKRLQQEAEEQQRKQKEESSKKQQEHTRREQDLVDVDPKRREVSQHEKELDRSKSDVSNEEKQRRMMTMAAGGGRKRQQVEQQQKPVDVSMNLSDSSSSSDDSDD